MSALAACLGIATLYQAIAADAGEVASTAAEPAQEAAAGVKKKKKGAKAAVDFDALLAGVDGQASGADDAMVMMLTPMLTPMLLVSCHSWQLLHRDDVATRLQDSDVGKAAAHWIPMLKAILNGFCTAKFVCSHDMQPMHAQ